MCWSAIMFISPIIQSSDLSYKYQFPCTLRTYNLQLTTSTRSHSYQFLLLGPDFHLAHSLRHDWLRSPPSGKLLPCNHSHSKNELNMLSMGLQAHIYSKPFTFEEWTKYAVNGSAGTHLLQITSCWVGRELSIHRELSYIRAGACDWSIFLLFNTSNFFVS